MTGPLSTLLELAGFAAVIVAAYFYDWRLALAAGGVVAVIFAYAMDDGAGRRDGVGGRTDL